METQLPSLKGAQPPPLFSANVRCGQTAGWMKTPPGTVVDLSPCPEAVAVPTTAVPTIAIPTTVIPTTGQWA